jgi:hypothetical protein
VGSDTLAKTKDGHYPGMINIHGEATSKAPAAADIDEEEEEEEEPYIFIPLTLAKPLPREPYKGNDPDFLSMVDFSRNQEWKDAVVAATREIITRFVGSNPRDVRYMGGDLRNGRSWLDFHYPLHAPVEYERIGIEITDEFIALSAKRIDAAAHHRIQNLLRNNAVLDSALTTVDRVWQDQWAKITPILKDNLPFQNLFPTLSPYPQRPSKPHIPKEAQNQEIEIVVKSGPDEKKFVFHILNLHSQMVNQFSDEVKPVVDGFIRRYWRKWREPPPTIPRGSIYVTGMCEVAGTHGAMVFAVLATFHPESGSFGDFQAQRLHSYRYKQYPLA